MVIKYVPGKDLQLADALSRDPIPDSPQDDDITEANIHVHTLIQNLPVTSTFATKLQQETETDRQLQQLRTAIKDGWPNEKSQVPPDLKPFWDVRESLTYEDGKIFKGEQLFIPLGLRKEMLAKIHEGHLGMDMCKRRAR